MFRKLLAAGVLTVALALCGFVRFGPTEPGEFPRLSGGNGAGARGQRREFIAVGGQRQRSGTGRRSRSARYTGGELSRRQPTRSNVA